MATINTNRMHDHSLQAIVTFILAGFSIMLNFIHPTPPPLYLVDWIKVFLYCAQFCAAVIAIIVGGIAIYEKWFKK